MGLLAAWVVRKAKRVGERADELVDQALDASLDRVHDLVISKLGADPALERLEIEAAESGEVGTRTQARVRMSLEEAVEGDPAFAARLAEAVRAAQQTSGQVTTGDKGVVISGGVHGSGPGVVVGGMTGGSINFGQHLDPSKPERA